MSVSVQSNKATLATAKAIPIFLALIVGYTSYVVTGPVVIDYLFNPPRSDIPRRFGAGLAILVVYFVLVIFIAAAWLRVLIVVWGSPGYTDLGNTSPRSESEPAPGLENFYLKDVFVCDANGYPIWCDQCQNWKPDRTHHNQDVGRCTLKMDHFCPWVGGVVGERSYKFFIQFLFYSFLLSGFGVGFLAYFVAERARKAVPLDVQWLICLGLAGFFCIFTIGMVGNSMWMVFQNLTTIENITFRTGTHHLAVLLPPAMQGQGQSGLPSAPKTAYLTDSSRSRSNESERPISSDLEAPAQTHLSQSLIQPRPPHADRVWKGTITYPTHLPVDQPPLPAPQLRTFAILETMPGMHIWRLGSAWLNFKAVFGSKPHHWFLPIRHSPCCDHSAITSQYELGPDFEALLIEAGLITRPEGFRPRNYKRPTKRAVSAAGQGRRKRRLDPGWKDGERPDGWISEKEARRVRNESRWQNANGQPHDRYRLYG